MTKKKVVNKEVLNKPNEIIIYLSAKDKNGWDKGLVDAFKELNKVEWSKKQERNTLLIKPGLGMIRVDDYDMLSLVEVSEDNMVAIVKKVNVFLNAYCSKLAGTKEDHKVRFLGRASHFLNGVIQEFKRIDIE